MVDIQILLFVAEAVAAVSLVLVLLFGEAFLTRFLTVPHLEFEHEVLTKSSLSLKLIPGPLAQLTRQGTPAQLTRQGTPAQLTRQGTPVTLRYYAIGVTNRAGRFHKTAEDCEVFLRLIQELGSKHRAFWLNYGDIRFEAPNLNNTKDIHSIADALRQKFLSLHATDLDPDSGVPVIVAFGVDALDKVYLATDPPILLPPPPEKGRNVVFFQISINMRDFPAIRSDVYAIRLGNWNDFDVKYFGKMKQVKRSGVKYLMLNKYENSAN